MSLNTIKKNRKTHIRQQAAELIGQYGYTATTMRDLAAKVGIEASSLYNHYKSKDALLREICFDMGTRFVTELDKVHSQTNLNEVEQLRAVLHNHVALLQSEPAAAMVANEEWRHLSEPDLSEYQALRRKYESGIINLVDKGIKAGYFKDIPPKVAMYTLLSALRWLQWGNTATKHLAPEMLNQSLGEWLISGLLVHKPA